jgi:hypothetical protein
MGSLWRSEEMCLAQLYLQAEAAYESVSALGELVSLPPLFAPSPNSTHTHTHTHTHTLPLPLSPSLSQGLVQFRDVSLC